MDGARGLVSASVVSRVMAVNSSHVKGRGSGQTASLDQFTRALPRSRVVGRARLFGFHRSQSTSTNLERLEVWPSHTPSEQIWHSDGSA
ncbi:hypothetical protein AVEN_131560-1 [Araneus ventricosus]|uniref:Uncharacterized protein n=1 Tax=Araneus ventricosus TaxID=182803 RepID=A0A4Y2MZI0_ARAVE|nr:hypothetical protein AVEN_131560-1 [Araneus ventricosus]